MGKIVIIEGRKFEGDKEIAAANADKAAIDRIKASMDNMSLSELKLLSKKLHSGRINFGTVLGEDFIEEVDGIISKMERKEKAVEEKQDLRVNVKKTTAKKPVQTDEDLDAQARKILEQQERTRKIILFASLFVAAACILYIAIYNITKQRSANTTDLLANLRDQAANDAQQSSDNNVENSGTIIHYVDEEEAPDILPEYIDIYNKNKRLIGWLEIADIGINGAVLSLPVMQTVDNEYYLTHGFNQENDKNGCIFMDCNCDAIKPSDNLILYGHHMMSGNMFGNLVKYEDYNFYLTHKTFKFDTIYEHGEYEVMFAFRTSLKTDDDISFKYYQFIDANGAEEFNSYMNEMASMSLYDTGVRAVWGDHLVTLSTCDYEEKNGRFAVVARKIN